MDTDKENMLDAEDILPEDRCHYRFIRNPAHDCKKTRFKYHCDRCGERICGDCFSVLKITELYCGPCILEAKPNRSYTRRGLVLAERKSRAKSARK